MTMIDPYCDYYEQDDDVRYCRKLPGRLVSCDGCEYCNGSGMRYGGSDEGETRRHDEAEESL